MVNKLASQHSAFHVRVGFTGCTAFGVLRFRGSHVELYVSPCLAHWLVLLFGRAKVSKAFEDKQKEEAAIGDEASTTTPHSRIRVACKERFHLYSTRLSVGQC